MNTVRKSCIYMAVWLLISCTPKPKPLVAEDLSVATPQNIPVPITLNITGQGSATLTYELGAPANGALTGTPPELTYTPANNYMGLDEFTYSASNGKVNSNTAVVSINVTAPIFPIKLINGIPEQASITLTLRKPSGATSSTVVINAYDADFPNEGEMIINSNAAIPLFGTSGVAGNTDKFVDVTLTVPATQWQDGSNSITFRHISTAGFIINNMRVSFQ